MFNAYLYQHNETISVAVATDQLILGGCDDDRAMSARVVQKRSEHETLEAAIDAAQALMNTANRNDYPVVREAHGEKAAQTGRTYDGSPVLYSLMVEADMGDDE